MWISTLMSKMGCHLPSEASVQVVNALSPQPQPEGAGHIGWMIQLGAFADEAEAERRLRSAQSMAPNLLGEADGFTERVTKGSKDLYRVRFAGLDKETAKAACHYFKRSDIECIALQALTAIPDPSVGRPLDAPGFCQLD
jgi:D-alanyl-D-alanine carboxypeptidase